jgi:predicted CXXCH cytochrome family protein
MARARQVVLALFSALLAAGALGAVQRDLSRPRDLRQTRYVQAAQCLRCHPDHSASFARTFHRTMTQSAARALAGVDLRDAKLDYFGVSARVQRNARGEATLSYQLPGAAAESFVIEKTVGSRRYQQYIARRGQELVRLPVAYHIEEQRWFHMNGAFLTPDPELTPEGTLARADYERHVTRWNDNCVFCHNVAPNPGKRAGTHGSVRFDTEVAELGIACEACHGPGGEHAARNANPLRRYVLHASGRRDPTIVNPARLSDARSLDVCGRCHGQRITDDVEHFLRRGDPFLPGEDLALYSAPLWRDTTLHGEQAFEARFWSDGTPRLTAYEYQGVLLSPCAQRGRLTCLSCHGMHEGDPRGQLRPSRQGAAMCTQCHGALSAPQAQAAHARHPADASLPSCADCHMPRIVYGVLDVHPSHRIESPAPARQAAEDRPDACSQCHLDKTRAWAARERARLFGPEPGSSPPPPGELGSSPPPPPGEAGRGLSELERALFQGDPIQRALAASAYGRAQPEFRSRADARASTASSARRLAFLLEVMENDPYPAIRHLAQRSARQLLAPSSELTSYVPETPRDQRSRALAALRARFALPSAAAGIIQTLRADASARAIEIGE